MANIKFKNLRKSYGPIEVIKGIDLEIKSGEFMVFVGPSGCGKSTLLRLISGLENITEGDLYFDEKRVNNLIPSDRGIAMVFQSYALYPHMSVYENMAFGLKLAKTSKKEMKERVLRAAEMLQIEELLERKPKQLSGGQRQRVAIGRAIVRDPKVFLFDEPLSNLDAALRVATRLEIAKLHHDMDDVTMVYVTHDQVEAMTLADRICVLRDGILEQVGTPSDLYDHPASLFVAGFIGSPKMNFLQGEIAKEFKCHTLGIRPEHLEIVASEQGAWSGKIIHTENLGSDHHVFVDIGASEPLVIRWVGELTLDLNATIYVKPMDARLHFFDANGKPIQQTLGENK